MSAVLHGMFISPGFRFVTFVLDTLGVSYEIREVNLFEGAHMKEEFLAVNPMKKIPAFVDSDGFAMAESRSIARYLVAKYGDTEEGRALYPADIKQRAQVDAMLDFDCELFQVEKQLFLPTFIATFPPACEQLYEGCARQLQTLDGMLAERKFVAIDHATLADYSILFTLQSLGNVELSLSPYPNLLRWSADLSEGNEIIATLADKFEDARQGLAKIQKAVKLAREAKE